MGWYKFLYYVDILSYAFQGLALNEVIIKHTYIYTHVYVYIYTSLRFVHTFCAVTQFQSPRYGNLGKAFLEAYGMSTDSNYRECI